MTPVYPILCVMNDAEAMRAVKWLRERAPLPRALVTLCASLEYSVGRGALLEVLEDERKAEGDPSE